MKLKRVIVIGAIIIVAAAGIRISIGVDHVRDSAARMTDA
jgi:uncharacterized membrane protein SpoIIM required for sporulation